MSSRFSLGLYGETSYSLAFLTLPESMCFICVTGIFEGMTKQAIADTLNIGVDSVYRIMKSAA
jgi:hypothetical protein